MAVYRFSWNNLQLEKKLTVVKLENLERQQLAVQLRAPTIHGVTLHKALSVALTSPVRR